MQGESGHLILMTPLQPVEEVCLGIQCQQTDIKERRNVLGAETMELCQLLKDTNGIAVGEIVFVLNVP